MSKRLRLAVAASAIAGILLVASLEIWRGRSGTLREHVWTNTRGDGVLNAISRIDAFDAASGSFSYYTGARARDTGPLTAAPTRVLTAATHGSVFVRLLGFEPYEHARADDDALELARIVSAATRQVFPGAAVPVEIDLHFMPEAARFSLAKRVDWNEGQPYSLAIFARERKLARTAPAHELYHVLALRRSLRGAPEAVRRPGAASSYEEAAAELYAACGELLAGATLQRPEPSNSRVTITDLNQTFQGALARDELSDALNLMRSGANGKGLAGFGPLFAATVFDQVFGDAAAITADSPQGTRLLESCTATAADPFALETMLARVAAAGGDASETQARTN